MSNTPIKINYDRWLPLESLTEKGIREIKKHLDVPNLTYYTKKNSGISTEGLTPYVQLWRERMGYLVVPREYRPLESHWKSMPEEIKEMPQFELPGGFPKSNLILREDQIPVYDAYLKFKKGIIELGCGKGKSPIALKLAEHFKIPTLIVVNTNQLMTQWKNLIEQFFPTLEKDRIGHVQQDVCRYEDCPFTIAMLHTIAGREYSQEFYRYFGLVVYDEVHNLSSNWFKTVCNKFWGMRMGLSASPKRPDGLDLIFRSHIGPVIYTDLTQEIKPEIHFVNTGIGPNSPGIIKSRLYSRIGILNWAYLYTAISQMSSFNSLILDYAMRATQKGRKILILGERIEQLKILSEQFSAFCPHVSNGLVIGEMSPDQRQLSLEKQAVFATSHLAEEGLDCPAFDTLFILFPKSTLKSIQQAVGRILRKHAGKEKPVAIIFVHEQFEPLYAISRTVRRNLKHLGYNFHEPRA